MVASFAVMSTTNYYTSQSEATGYYTSDQKFGVWLRGHSQLGVAAGDAVEPDTFDRVCAGVGLEGNALVKVPAGQRMLGVDITCSAPKSFSVLFGLGDEALRQGLASDEFLALEAVVQAIEREIPLARRGHGGLHREQGRFLVAAFSHSEARPEEHADGSVFPDVQRHHHLCLPNLIERNDGSWGAINSVGLRSARNTLGALFRLELSSALQARGFAIERAEDGWSWRIAGVPTELTDYFSARRKSLEEELAAAGLTSAAAPALAAAINVSERRAKLALTEGELTQRWHEATRALGYEPEAVVAAAAEAGRAVQIEAAPVFDRNAVLLGLTEHDATFSRIELIGAVANGLVGTGVSANVAIETADALVANGDVVMLVETVDGPVYSTPAMLQAERDLVDVSRRGASRRVAAPAPELVETLLRSNGLNAEQIEVVRAATSGDGLVLLQGGAGTGKSTALKVSAEAWKAAGYDVVVAAVAWRTANTLGAELAVPARAIDSWLAAVEHGKVPFSPKTVVLIEEAGLSSTLQTLKLLRAIDRAGAIATIVGDENQLRPVAAGHAMRLIRETVGAVKLTTVVRQREVWAREAPTAFARGDAQTGLQAFADRGLVRMHTSPRATVEALADRWQQVADEAPSQSCLIMAKTNAEVRAISAAIRSKLRERGLINGPDVEIEAADASGNRHMLKLATGDRIRFLRRVDQLKVVNGTEAKVVGIHSNPTGSVRIEAERDGERITFSPEDIADGKGRVRLAHAYVATLFQAQGMTVDRSLVLLSSRFDRHDAYVASSRARERTELFVDSRTLDKEIGQDHLPVKDADRNPARTAHLAGRLARQSVKTNALDYLVAGERTRAREKELEHELQA